MRGEPARPLFAMRDIARRRWVYPGEPGYGALLWHRYRSLGYRVLFTLGVWEVAEGGYYRDGRLVWESSAARRDPEFPRDGREFWGSVL